MSEGFPGLGAKERDFQLNKCLLLVLFGGRAREPPVLVLGELKTSGNTGQSS